MSPTTIATTVLSALFATLLSIVVLYLRGIARDMADMRKHSEGLKDLQEKRLTDAVAEIRSDMGKSAMEMRAEVGKQQEQLTQVRIEMGKMQEQLYALLRGAGEQRPVRQ